MIFSKSFSSFFKDHPSLLPSLFFLLGFALSVKMTIALFIPIVVLSLSTLKKPRKLLLLYSLTVSAFFYGKQTEAEFPDKRDALKGRAIFSIEEIKIRESHLKKKTSLQGFISSMEGELGEKVYNIPCSVTIPSSFRPMEYKTYQIEGTLQKKENFFSFIPDKDLPWKGVNGSFCFPERRFAAKNILKKSIHKRYPNSRVSDFIIALTLGDLDNGLLRFSFSKLGLQHILAISGFHFSLLSLFIGSFLRFFLKEKTAILTLLLIVTIYFFLLHEAPSIIRAYLSTVLYLMGRLFGYRTNALNLLGVTLLLELFLFPQSINNLGFQLSFLATASILLFFPVTFSWMTKLLPKRTSLQMLSLHPLEKGVCLFFSLLRSTLAVNLAVSLTLIPACLRYFSTFPLASLIYNLFVPLSLFITLFLFLLAIPFTLIIPSFSHFIDRANEIFTGKIVQLIIESPNCLDLSLRFRFTSDSFLYLYFLFIFSLAILAKTKKNGEILWPPRSHSK